MSNYMQKYYEELFLNLLNNANTNGLISHNSSFQSYVKNKKDISSFYVMTLSILADSIEDVYYDMTTVYESAKIQYALDTDLDDIGLIVGCPRPLATKSGVELTFQLNTAYENTITLPPNILVSTIDGIAYSTTESVIIPACTREVKVYAESLEEGIGTRVLEESLNIVQSTVTVDGIGSIGLSVTNETASSGGKEAYSDEEYRVLLMDWVKNNIKGSKEAYERYFANLDGINSYKLIPNWNGVTGTLKIILEPGYPYQLKRSYDEIVGSVCQFTEDIVMFAPSPVPIDIYAKCNVDIDEINPYSNTEKEEIKSRIEDAIKTYVDGDVFNYTGLKIGEDFIPYKLGVFLSNNIPELKNITFYNPNSKPSNIDDLNQNEWLDPYSPITINDEQKGTVNSIEIIME